MMYAATEIEGTSWMVVSATPYAFVTQKIGASANITLLVALLLLVLLAGYLYFVISKFLNPDSKVVRSATSAAVISPQR